jgi:hypothetical protein
MNALIEEVTSCLVDAEVTCGRAWLAAKKNGDAAFASELKRLTLRISKIAKEAEAILEEME